MDTLRILLVKNRLDAKFPDKASTEEYRGVKVEVISSHEGTITQLRRVPFYHIVLIDMDTSSQSASRLAKKLKKIGFSGLVLFYTSQNLSEIEGVYHKSFADGFISKRYHLGNLRYALRHNTKNVCLPSDVTLQSGKGWLLCP